MIRAEIKNETSGAVARCMFNPKEYTFSKQNNWQPSDSDQKNSAPLKFSGGAAASLKLQLLFDTTEERPGMPGGDVREHTRALWDMMKIDPAKKQPPFVRFTWGNYWSFQAVIESIAQKFVLFDDSGRPLRAILDVSFRQIADEGQYPRQNPTSGGSPDDRVRVVSEGETLMTIAYEEYGSAGAWRHLADINQIDDPLRPPPGRLLIVKPLPR